MLAAKEVKVASSPFQQIATTYFLGSERDRDRQTENERERKREREIATIGSSSLTG